MAAPTLLLMATMVAAGWGRAAGDCSEPPALENGMLGDKYILLTAFPSGMTVVYRCIPGFLFAPGHGNSITCNDNAWTPLQAQCKIKTCGSPGEILNGKFTSTGNDFGSTVTFSCDRGYQIVGKNTRRCVVDGWSGQVPTCEAVKCLEVPALENGKSSSLSGADFWEYGMSVDFLCNGGYSLIGASTITCEATGDWSGAPPVCKVVKCSNPKVPENGRMIGGFADSYPYGHEITYRCNDGYVIFGESVIKCNENSEFVPSLPTCKRDIKCQLPKLSEHVNITAGFGPVYRYEDTISFTCSDGYVIDGESVIKCGGSGEFVPSPPTCKRDIKCQLPKLSEHVNITAGFGPIYRYEDTISFTCSDGYVMDGESVIKCGGSGEFVPSPPTCKHIKCQLPKLSEYVNITAGFGPVYRYEDTISFTCNDGYVMDGESVIKCGGSGEFVPSPPTCKRGPSINTTIVIVCVLVAVVIVSILIAFAVIRFKKYKRSII
ncbi:C4b-binding protein alpha chain-like isoform X2 [Rhinoraja longicauda]